MKLMIIVGARPNFMKAAPILAAIKGHNDRLSAGSSQDFTRATSDAIQPVFVHTGQHYDKLMSDSFFLDLNLSRPDFHLGVGSGSHAIQTAEIMKRFEPILLEERPDVLLVVGDVNSTVACALVAAKVSYDGFGTRPLIAHVEAGLRSFDHTMPEEINRILTDHLSDLLFVTEESGLRNLGCEGVPPEKVYFAGNTMIDSLLAYKDKADSSQILEDLALSSNKSNPGSSRTIAPYALLTLHRPANVDNSDAFRNVLDGIQELARECTVVFPAHPRTQKRIREFGFEHRFAWQALAPEADALTPVAITSGSIRILDPLGYLDFLSLMKNASLVITDSGGIQEETTCLGVPCVTVRENTERPVTITSGTNILAGVRSEDIREAIRRQRLAKRASNMPEKWDGKSAVRILEVIRREAKVRQDSASANHSTRAHQNGQFVSIGF